jgi:hypothetical protein
MVDFARARERLEMAASLETYALINAQHAHTGFPKSAFLLLV